MTIHPNKPAPRPMIYVDGLPFVDPAEAENYFRRVHASLALSPLYTPESAAAYLRRRLQQIEAAR